MFLHFSWLCSDDDVKKKTKEKNTIFFNEVT
jgi:hypothetical protein